MKDDYSDIINLSRPMSSKHKPMARDNRASQFSPFAALTGYEEAIAEENRLTYKERFLSSDEEDKINESLCCLKPNDEIEITHFEKDTNKKGGLYKTTKAKVTKVNLEKGELHLTDGSIIPLCSIKRLKRLNASDI